MKTTKNNNMEQTIKNLFLKSFEKTDEMELSGNYSREEYEYEEGYKHALADLYKIVYQKELYDIFDENLAVSN